MAPASDDHAYKWNYKDFPIRFQEHGLLVECHALPCSCGPQCKDFKSPAKVASLVRLSVFVNFLNGRLNAER